MIAVIVAVALVEALIGVILAVILASFCFLPPVIHAFIVDNHVWTEIMLNPLRTGASVDTVGVARTIAFTTYTLSMTLVNAPFFTFAPFGT